MRPSVRTSFLTVVIGAVLTALVGSSLSALADVTGPDVSGWQHPSGTAINWSSVKANGQSFTFIKATEGTTYRNPYFAGDWSGSGSAGLMHGAYHFARPSTAAGSAAAQAQYFVAAAGKQNTAGTLPPVLDLEVTGGLSSSQLISWASTWLSTVKALTGRTPIVYSYPSFWTGSMANTTAFSGYPLWIAGYSSEPGPLGGWAHWTFWQYSDAHTIPGISGSGDISKFYGTITQLRALALIGGNGTVPVAESPWHQGQDFYGAGRATVGVFRPSTGQWWLRGHAPIQYGQRGDIPVPGDYFGTGIDQLAIWRPSTGQWAVRGHATVVWGVPGDIPVPADYTGNGVTQVAVYRPSTNTWWVQGMQPFHWGQRGDIPVPGNYNGGDAGDDFAVYRPSTGQWWIPGQAPMSYGQSGDVPLPARYSSSLASSPSVWRPSDHTWAVRAMSTLSTGAVGDVQLSADISGRGYADRVIFRPSTGRWYVNNVYLTTFGVRGDVPVTGENVPLSGATPYALTAH